MNLIPIFYRFSCLLLLAGLIFPVNQLNSQSDLSPALSITDLYTKEFSPEDALKIWIDTSGQFHDFLTIPAKRHLFSSLQDPNLSSQESAYWLNFSLKNEAADSLKFVLKMNVFDSLSLVTLASGNAHVQHAGLLVVYSERERERFLNLGIDKYSFEISIPPATTVEYFLRVKANIRFENPITPFHLHRQDERFVGERKDVIYFLIFSTLFFTVLSFVIVFFLLQFIFNRDPAYLFYICYLISCFIFFWWKFEKSNTFVNYVFNNLGKYYYYFEVPFALCIFLSYAWFINYFVAGKDDSSSVNKFIKTGTLIFLIYLIFYVITSQIWGLAISWQYYAYVRILIALWAAGVIYIIMRERRPLFLFILTGTSFVLIGGFWTSYLSFSADQHYFGPWDYPLLPIQIGVLIEVLFFSIGLGYKGRLVLKEKNESQRKLIHELKKNEGLQDKLRRGLELEVAVARKEIEFRQQELEKGRRAQLIAQHNEQLAVYQLKSLRIQLKPHFIFNCINSIRNLIGKKEGQVAQVYLRKFAGLLREILDYSEQDAITLFEEIELTRKYLEMEKLRFPNRFQVDLRIPEEHTWKQVKVPPIILQPFAENAIKHGLLPLVGTPLLKIEVLDEEQEYIIVIDDNGKGIDAAKRDSAERQGMGMKICEDRLSLFNARRKKNLQLSIFDKSKSHFHSTGTRIELSIPKSEINAMI